MNDLTAPTPPVMPADMVGAIAALGAGGPRRPVTAGQAEQAAKDFESLLLNKLLDEVQRAMPRSGYLDSPTSRQVEGIFWLYLSRDLAQKGGLGIWKQLQHQLDLTSPTQAPRPEQAR